MVLLEEGRCRYMHATVYISVHSTWLGAQGGRQWDY